jgi:hypothetical protein
MGSLLDRHVVFKFFKFMSKLKAYTLTVYPVHRRLFLDIFNYVWKTGVSSSEADVSAASFILCVSQTEGKTLLLEKKLPRYLLFTGHRQSYVYSIEDTSGQNLHI